MKNLILFVLLLIPFSLLAQIQVDDRKASMNDQTDDWMVKISSDSEMRVQMMDMIIDKTIGDAVEMKKLANSISNSTELRQMVIDTNPERAGGEKISIEPLGITNDNTKIGKMSGTQPIPSAPKK
jgi:hypothetical protein